MEIQNAEKRPKRLFHFIIIIRIILSTTTQLYFFVLRQNLRNDYLSLSWRRSVVAFALDNKTIVVDNSFGGGFFCNFSNFKNKKNNGD